MKREFSDHIKIAVVNDGTVGSESVASVYSDVSFDEDPKSSSQGVLYEQSLKIAINKSDAAQFLKLLPRFRAVVWLHDGTDYHKWGNADIPVTVVVTPKLDSVALTMSCKSLLPLIRS